MALDFQNVSITFAEGIDTKTDKKLVLPGKLLTLFNGVMTVGRKIKKRFGNRALGVGIYEDSNNLGVGQKLGTFRDELIQFNEDKLYSYSEGLNEYVLKGDIASCGVTTRQEMAETNDLARIDSGISQNVKMLVTTEIATSDTKVRFYDTTTDNLIKELIYANIENFKVISTSQYLFLFYFDGSDFKVDRFDPLTLSFSMPLSGTLGSGTEPIFDAYLVGNYFFYCYKNASGTVVAQYVTFNAAVGQPLNGFPAAFNLDAAIDPYTFISVFLDRASSNAIFYYNDNTGQLLSSGYFTVDGTSLFDNTVVYDNSGISTSSRFTKFSILGIDDTTYHFATTGYVVDSGNTNYFIIYGIGDDSGPTSDQDIDAHYDLYSDLFYYNDEVYFIASNVSDSQPFYILFKQQSSLDYPFEVIPVAILMKDKAAPTRYDDSGSNFEKYLRGVHVNSIDSKLYFFAETLAPFGAAVEGEVLDFVTSISVSVIDFQFENIFQNVEINNQLMISGGLLHAYDGARVHEHNYFHGPEATGAATSGGTLTDGVYQAFFTYEWVDDNGQFHISRPSLPVTVTTLSPNSQIEFEIRNYLFTAKEDVKIGVYITDVDSSIPFKRIVLDQMAGYFTTYTYAANSVVNEGILYTTAGILENTQIGSVKYLAVFKERLVATGLEDELKVLYSKPVFDGFGVEMSDELASFENATGGAITSCGVVDDKLIIGKAQHLCVRSGQPPDELGGNSTLSGSDIITSDIGCSNQRSIVSMPVGLMMKTQKGIYLLDRSLAVQYVGADVELYNTADILSGDLLADTNQVRFLTNQNVCLMYDYYFNQWSVFDNHIGLDAVIWKRVFVYLRDDDRGTVYKEQTDYFKDEGKTYRLKIGTAWIKMAGVQGFQRVRRFAVLGESVSSHVLRVNVGYDYQEYFNTPYIFRPDNVLDSNVYGEDAFYGDSSPYGGVTDTVYQFRSRLAVQKCEAIRFLFEDVVSSDSGGSYTLSDLSLEVGIKRGLFKMGLSKTV